MSTPQQLLAALGVPAAAFADGTLVARSPIDGATMGRVADAGPDAMKTAIAAVDSHSTSFQACAWS